MAQSLKPKSSYNTLVKHNSKQTPTITRMGRSMGWGYLRIMAGTIAGGSIGFYIMHRLEISYKAKWDERLRNYEQELNKKKHKSNEFEEEIL